MDWLKEGAAASVKSLDLAWVALSEVECFLLVELELLVSVSVLAEVLL